MLPTFIEVKKNCSIKFKIQSFKNDCNVKKNMKNNETKKFSQQIRRYKVTFNYTYLKLKNNLK